MPETPDFSIRLALIHRVVGKSQVGLGELYGESLSFFGLDGSLRAHKRSRGL